MNLPARLRDIIVDAVDNESDMELVDADLTFESELDLPPVDVLIVATGEPHDDALPSRLLSIAPRMSVLVVAMSGVSAALYQLKPEKKPLGQVTAANLITAIRRGSGQADSS
jgi:hypothetical protein